MPILKSLSKISHVPALVIIEHNLFNNIICLSGHLFMQLKKYKKIIKGKLKFAI